MNGLRERIITTLTAPLDADAFLEILGPLHTRRSQGVVKSVRSLTATSAEITIAVGRSWPGHQPGQFVPIGVEIDGVRHTRCYSLTSAPGSQLISIAVQAKPDGFVSDHLVHHTKPGTVLALGQPEGDFTLATATSHQILLLTGGSGITPAMSMLRSLASSRPADSTHWDIALIHFAPTAAEAMFADEIVALAERHPWLTVTIRTTRDPGDRKSQHLSTNDPGAAGLSELCPDWTERDVYACGPAGLIDYAVDHWSQINRSQRVHVERFAPAQAVNPSDDLPTVGINTATFAASGVSAAAPTSTPLLEVAEAAGLLPEAGCRMGICKTCTVALVDGCVTDLRNGHQSDAGSHVQICVSAATDGDVTLAL